MLALLLALLPLADAGGYTAPPRPNCPKGSIAECTDWEETSCGANKNYDCQTVEYCAAWSCVVTTPPQKK